MFSLNNFNFNLDDLDNPTNLTSRVLTPELLEVLQSLKLEEKVESILRLVYNDKLTSDKAQRQIMALIEFALDTSKLKAMDFSAFKSLIDEGDYIQATGILDHSQSGEPSLFVEDYKILTKSLRPLPEKMDYNNVESRFLDKVADYKMNTTDENGLSVRDIVKLKQKYWSIWREEMENEGFLEVEAPIFETIPGGAEAKPFTTFYNELDQDVYLRLSLELPLKKLIAGGFEKVFEIGRIFRNEGSSPQHLQEYTQIEWYCAYTEYLWAAKFTMKVYQRIVEEILGTMTQIAYNGASVNWAGWCSIEFAKANNWELITNEKDTENGWPVIPYFEAVRYFSYGKIDTENKNAEELVELCKTSGINDVKVEDGMGTLLDKLWKKARVNTTNPFFLALPPVELEPLAKRDSNNPSLTQRWQIVAGGAELGKAFSELNDPVDQFCRFEDQQKARDNGNEEAQFMDLDYVKAMEYGMPPMSGFGTSERFVSFILGKHIRECVTFPHVRESSKDINKVTKVFNIILNSDPSIPVWQRLNAVSHLTGSVIAHNLHRQDVIDIEKVFTKDNLEFPMDLRWGIHIKQTNDNNTILELFKNSKANPALKTTLFGEDFFSAKNDIMAVENFKNKDSKDVKWIGVLVYGPKTTVDKLTKGFERFQ